MKQDNVLYITHDVYGAEEFALKDLRWTLQKVYAEDDEDGDPEGAEILWEFTFACDTEKALLLSSELSEVINARPNLEVTALVHGHEPLLLAGEVLIQDRGYDYNRDENLSNLYYFSHNSVEKVRIEILESDGPHLRLHFTGEALISNYGKGVPDAKLEAILNLIMDLSFIRSFG